MSTTGQCFIKSSTQNGASSVTKHAAIFRSRPSCIKCGRQAIILSQHIIWVSVYKEDELRFIIQLPILFFFWRDSPQWARASSFTRFLDHTQRRTTVGRTPLDEWSARRRDLYLTTHNTHNKHPCSWCDSNPVSNFMFCWPCILLKSCKYNRLGAKRFLLYSFVTLYRWLSGMQGGMKVHSALHTRQSSI